MDHLDKKLEVKYFNKQFILCSWEIMVFSISAGRLRAQWMMSLAVQYSLYMRKYHGITDE